MKSCLKSSARIFVVNGDAMSSIMLRTSGVNVWVALMPCTSSLNFWKSVITSVLLVGVAAGASLVVRPLSLDAWSRGAMCGGVGSVGIGPVAARGFAGG